MHLKTPSSEAAFLSEHASVVDWLHARSDASDWGVTREEFAAVLHRSATHHFGGTLPKGERLGEYLQGLHLKDLALACALRRGSGKAWQHFVGEYRPVLYGAARAIVKSAGEERARELADSLYADLYGLKTGAQASLLDYFHGRSKLATWLRALLAQRYIDALRADRHEESLDAEPSPAGQLPVQRTATEPTETIDRQRLLPRLRRALTEALASLSASERLLISLYYVEELTLAQIARVKGVHEATISRQLDRIRRELREDVETLLAGGGPPPNGQPGEAGLSAAEIELCFKYALEDWGFDLSHSLSDANSKEAVIKELNPLHARNHTASVLSKGDGA
jgi:RNA polymerase sigma-70 factor (ECF subfamily)